MEKIYTEIKEKQPDLVFTEQYLVTKLNKRFMEQTEDICSLTDENKLKELEKYIPQKTDERIGNIEKIIELGVSLLNSKTNIDSNTDTNFQESQEESNRLLNELMEEGQVNSEEDINNLLNIMNRRVPVINKICE